MYFPRFPLVSLAFIPALQDTFVKRCKAISEKVQEEISEVEAEWLTVSDMEKLEFSESLSEILEATLMFSFYTT